LSNLKKEYRLFKFLSLGNWKFFVAGLALSILWSSASTATKLGLTSAQPFVISSTRFLIAGILMLFVSHVILGNRLPSKAEWKSIIVYGFLNVSLYLGLYIIAMQQVSAGLGSLAIAINPVFISLISFSLFAHSITKRHVLSLAMCLLGVTIAAFPLIKNSFATPLGIGLLLTSMIVYSFATVYFSRIQWNGLQILTINGWQTIIGGIFTFPILLLTYQPEKNLYDANFWKSVLWLSIPVSIVAVQLWLYLVKQNPISASFWLFLCPIFGFAFAKIMMQEPISWFTFLGVLLVLSGLYLVQRLKK
jgi:drug/metabolite transporter (DMT)-like permease